MGKKVFIVTGASRGLGAAIVERLLAPGHRLLCIARNNPAAMRGRAEENGAALEQWNLDLGQPLEAAARLEGWLRALDAGAIDEATLFNNAALLTRIGPVDACDDAELSASLRVSLEAPMLLTAAFLRATQSWKAPRRVVNISSGLGRRAMAGTAPYCAAKAGMDHFSRAVALDEATRPNGARIVSLAPGVIDTDMQVQLRAADASGFPDRATFVGLKTGGQLTSSFDAADRVLAYLGRADFGSNPVGDVRDA